MVKNMELDRGYVWWRRMHSTIDGTEKGCTSCQQALPLPSPAPCTVAMTMAPETMPACSCALHRTVSRSLIPYHKRSPLNGPKFTFWKVLQRTRRSDASGKCSCYAALVFQKHWFRIIAISTVRKASDISPNPAPSSKLDLRLTIPQRTRKGNVLFAH